MGLFDRGVQMLLTTVGAFAAFSLMTIAVGTDYWLYSRGVCKSKSVSENETSKKNEEVMTHSGLWRTCCLEGISSPPTPPPLPLASTISVHALIPRCLLCTRDLWPDMGWIAKMTSLNGAFLTHSASLHFPPSSLPLTYSAVRLHAEYYMLSHSLKINRSNQSGVFWWTEVGIVSLFTHGDLWMGNRDAGQWNINFTFSLIKGAIFYHPPPHPKKKTVLLHWEKKQPFWVCQN